jgi:hypothetical protein
MFGKLPDLFGKAFAIGFFLPAAVVAVGIAGILSLHGMPKSIADFAQDEKTLGSTVAVALIWLFSIVLMAINTTIIRTLEGYGPFNPLRLGARLERRRFEKLLQEITDVDGQIFKAEDGHTDPEPSLLNRSRDAHIMRAARFPDERNLLPTRFGNVIRAFEVYSRDVYGIESIQGWPRLVAVIPADYQAIVDEAKAQLDFWINLSLGGILLAAFYAVSALIHGAWVGIWIPIICFVVTGGACTRIAASAAAWGELVTAAFDLYRGDLCKQLGLAMPPDLAGERAMWAAVSRTAIYRSAENADPLDPFRATGSGS